MQSLPEYVTTLGTLLEYRAATMADGPAVDVSVKVTVSGAIPLVVSCVKLAVGPTAAPTVM